MRLQDHDLLRVSISGWMRPKTSIAQPRTTVRENTVALWVPTTNRVELVGALMDMCANSTLDISLNGKDPERADAVSVKFTRAFRTIVSRSNPLDDAEMLVTHVIDIVNKPPVEEDPVRPTAFPAGTTYH